MTSTRIASIGRKNVSGKKFGKCVVCGDRVREGHEFVTAEEGYCHKSCLS